MARSHLVLAVVILTGALAGCSERLGPADVAGTYFLKTVNGAPVPLPGINAPVAGTITLTATGRAERRISYAIDAQGTVREFTATGTFHLKGSELRLALQEGTNLWTPSADLVGTTITLTYPNAADGPDIVERYLHP
jgi:hypothetical protein